MLHTFLCLYIILYPSSQVIQANNFLRRVELRRNYCVSVYEALRFVICGREARIFVLCLMKKVDRANVTMHSLAWSNTGFPGVYTCSNVGNFIPPTSPVRARPRLGRGIVFEIRAQGSSKEECASEKKM